MEAKILYYLGKVIVDERIKEISGKGKSSTSLSPIMLSFIRFIHLWGGLR